MQEIAIQAGITLRDKDSDKQLQCSMAATHSVSQKSIVYWGDKVNYQSKNIISNISTSRIIIA